MNPLSATFGAAVWLRNALYDQGVLKSRALSHPVVSVGNISVGGAGKTPFIIALGALLKQHGIGFDVLSRGYGRKAKEIAIVDPAGRPEQFGDEPLLIARKLEVPVVVGSDRYRAGLLAEEKFPRCKLHLLDDGFQHRRLHRDLDIVLFSDEDRQDVLLPFGRLREPLSALRRAAVVALAADSPLPPIAGKVWRVRRKIHAVGAVNRIVAFCGIARPKQFFDGLRQLGIDIAGTIAFADHHGYNQGDIDRLLRLKTESGASGFVTTGKDAVNLGALAQQLQSLQVAELEIELENAGLVLETLLSTLERKCGV